MNSLVWVLTLAGSLAIPSGAEVAAPAAAPHANVGIGADSLLAELTREALASRPEIAQAQAALEADLTRVPQARSLPDPIVSAGLQNDGIDRLRVGEMETSWWSLGAAQTLPWFGKRSLRGRAQLLAARQSEADLERARLTTRAEVERGFLDLMLIRDQLMILGRLEVLWAQAEGLSRSRYETGDGAQSDVLRAQLERNRLRQQRWALLAEERRRLAVLNRSVGRALDDPLPTPGSVADLPDPAVTDSTLAEADAESRSPELARARFGAERSNALLALARREWVPDFTVSGGVMPRGGELELMTMWQAGLSLSLPLWGASRQAPAVRESRLRVAASTHGVEAVRRLLRQRQEERRAVLAALLETNRLYRSGLLVQSEATVASTMSQYQVGRVPFASVLEALRGYLADLVGYYESVGAAHRIDIAARELSLDPVAAPGLAGVGGGAMPGTSGMNAGPAPSAAPPSPMPAGPTSSAMPRM